MDRLEVGQTCLKIADPTIRSRVAPVGNRGLTGHVNIYDARSNVLLNESVPVNHADFAHYWHEISTTAVSRANEKARSQDRASWGGISAAR
jgi:hypothetical protein